MNCLDKYNKNRLIIRNGDIILTRGKRLISKAIMFFDNCYYTHSGLVVETNNRLLIVDSNEDGVHPEFLSYRLKRMDDFCILRHQSVWNMEQSKSVEMALSKAEEDIKYDFSLLLDIAVYRTLGLNLGLNHDNKDLCSEFVRRYVRLLPKYDGCFDNPNIPTKFITPHDYCVYRSKQWGLILNEVDLNKYRQR